MIKTDNMGGFISADYILLSELHRFSADQNVCSLLLKNKASWKALDCKTGGIHLSVVPTLGAAGELFTLSGSILLKNYCPEFPVLRSATFLLLRVQLVDQTYKVLGTDEYPLRVSLKPITPTKASEFLGYELAFEGKQLFEPPVLSL